MNNTNYFNHMFESIPDYRKSLIRNDVNLIYECAFLKGGIHYLYKNFKNILLELKEEDLDFIKIEEESVIEKILKK